MAVSGEILTSLPPEVVHNIAELTFALQALGGILLLYFIFNIVNMILSRKRNREIEQINKNLEQIKRLLGKKK